MADTERMRSLMAALLICGATAGQAQTSENEPAIARASSAYLLVEGDQLSIDLVGTEQGMSAQVDIDGEVRLADVGAVPVAGLTLDAAEAAIEKAIADAGLFLDPQASLSILQYAPIVIMGDVSAPGLLEYQPRMTVASALAMAGGSQTAGTSRNEIDRARAEVTAQLRSINLDIAATVTRIARLEAALDDQAEVALSDAMRAAIPSPETVPLDDLRDSEMAILANEQTQREEVFALWDEETRTMEAQAALLRQRIEVQQEVLGSAAEDLETAKELQERGLQTSSRLSSAELREADARSRALELESALVSIERQLIDTRRQKSQYTRNRKGEVLDAMRDAKLQLDESSLAYARMLEQGALLSGGGLALLSDADNFEMRFTLRSPRAELPEPQEVTMDTRLLPGDTLTVDMVLIGRPSEG